MKLALKRQKAILSNSDRTLSGKNKALFEAYTLGFIANSKIAMDYQQKYFKTKAP